MPTPLDALNYAKRFIGNIPVDDASLQYRLLDDAHKKLWMAAPWRWTVSALTPVQLVNGQQDIPVPAVGDFQYLVHAALVDGDNKWDLAVSSALPQTTAMVGRPSQVQYTAGTPDLIRFMPVPAGYTDGPWMFAVYKKTAPDIGAGNASTDYTALTGMPDDWFWVYQEIVLLKALLFAQSPKAGGVTAVDGKVQYTGQYGVVEAAINDMRDSETKVYTSIGVEVKHG